MNSNLCRTERSGKVSFTSRIECGGVTHVDMALFELLNVLWTSMFTKLETETSYWPGSCPMWLLPLESTTEIREYTRNTIWY